MLLLKSLKYIILWSFFKFFVSSNVAKDLYDKFHQSGYKVKFERSDVFYINKSMVDCKHTVFKYNRTTKATNFSFVVYEELGNDVELVFQAYKFLSNEYRIFPMRFQLNLCKSIRADIGGMSQYLSCGNFTGCPIKANKPEYICNFLINEKQLPPLIPEGSYMMEWTMYHKKHKILTFHDLYIVYKILTPK